MLLPLEVGHGKGFSAIFLLQQLCILIWNLHNDTLEQTVAQREYVGFLQ